MTHIVDDVFDFVADYADELREQRELVTEFDSDTGLVLFCREFFNQFFVEQFEVQVVTFSSDEASNVWVKVRPQLSQSDAREPIVAGFREFCQDFETIVGEHYDRGGELTAFRRSSSPISSRASWAGRQPYERPSRTRRERRSTP